MSRLRTNRWAGRQSSDKTGRQAGRLMAVRPRVSKQIQGLRENKVTDLDESGQGGHGKVRKKTYNELESATPMINSQRICEEPGYHCCLNDLVKT